MTKQQNRREFLYQLAAVTGGFVLLPSVTACGTSSSAGPKDEMGKEAAKQPTSAPASAPAMSADVPVTKPEGWEPIAYNRERGNAGAIPKTYHESINGPDGDKKHLGKHLPYVPAELDAAMVPAGFIAIMWGDPGKGYAKHPNAARSEENKEGHWYNWIRIRKAADGEMEELESKYSDWPSIGEGDNGKYVVHGGGEVSADKGRNTVYLAALPKDVKKGDTIRIWAHCLTHGEYVDFLTL